jgi:hypothetical protein
LQNPCQSCERDGRPECWFNRTREGGLRKACTLCTMRQSQCKPGSQEPSGGVAAQSEFNRRRVTGELGGAIGDTATTTAAASAATTTPAAGLSLAGILAAIGQSPEALTLAASFLTLYERSVVAQEVTAEALRALTDRAELVAHVSVPTTTIGTATTSHAEAGGSGSRAREGETEVEDEETHVVEPRRAESEEEEDPAAVEQNGKPTGGSDGE